MSEPLKRSLPYRVLTAFVFGACVSLFGAAPAVAEFRHSGRKFIRWHGSRRRHGLVMGSCRLTFFTVVWAGTSLLTIASGAM